MIPAFPGHGKPPPACVLASSDVIGRPRPGSPEPARPGLVSAHRPTRFAGRPAARAGRPLRAMRAVPSELSDLPAGSHRNRVPTRADSTRTCVCGRRAATRSCRRRPSGSLPRLSALRSSVSSRRAIRRIAHGNPQTPTRAAWRWPASANDRMACGTPCAAGSPAGRVSHAASSATETIAATAAQDKDRHHPAGSRAAIQSCAVSRLRRAALRRYRARRTGEIVRRGWLRHHPTRYTDLLRCLARTLRRKRCRRRTWSTQSDGVCCRRTRDQFGDWLPRVARQRIGWPCTGPRRMRLPVAARPRAALSSRAPAHRLAHPMHPARGREKRPRIARAACANSST